VYVKHLLHLHAFLNVLFSFPHFRIAVIALWLQRGLPLSQIDVLDNLEALGQRYSLGGRTNLSREIPTLREAVLAIFREEVKGKEVSVCFDGTGFFGEAFAVVVRFVHNGDVQERLAALRLLDKSMDGMDIARAVMDALDSIQVCKDHVLFFDSDGASANKAAFDALTLPYRRSHHIVCISHTLNNAGKSHRLENLNQFLKLWNAIFSNSTNAKKAWLATGASAPPTPSPTRWWAAFEQALYLKSKFPHILPFISNRNFSFSIPARQQLIDFLRLREVDVRRELCALEDVAKRLVDVTYLVEGKRALAIILYDCIQGLRLHFNNIQYVEMEKLFQAYPHSDAKRQETIAALQPLVDHFRNRFDGDNCEFNRSVGLFQSASLANPAAFRQQYQLGLPHLQSLVERFIFYKQDPIAVDLLMGEAHLYYADAAEFVAGDNYSELIDNVQEWWKARVRLPAWRQFSMRMYLMQPSSASAERVFSVLSGTFKKDQSASLHDYVEATMMLKINLPEGADIRNQVV